MPERVELQVLVADGVERIGTQHRGQLALLAHPHAFFLQRGGNFFGETQRVLQVVEHREGAENC